MSTPALFSPLTLRSITLRNRIAVSPMCQYSCEDGFATDWHLVHLGSRATGGAGLVIVEAAAVEARGRITAGDLGLYKDDHVAPLARIASFMKAHGAVPGIQIAHAGRKASCHLPWKGGLPLAPNEGAWQTVAPSPIPFLPNGPPPAALTSEEIRAVTANFVAAARRALAAGYEVLEVHGAHGYLAHEFLSPLSNKRTDEYGGSLENRMRFLVETTEAVRAVWPSHLPLFVRISATDWMEGGWSVEESVELAKVLKSRGVDLIDCSSSGLAADAQPKLAPGFQVPFAERIRKEVEIATGAVGLITDPQQAEDILRHGQADLILLARELLRNPYWPLHAARALGIKPEPPSQYLRAFA